MAAPDHALVLHAVASTDGMTADFYPFDMAFIVSDAPSPFGVSDDLRVLVAVPSARASIRRCASAASHSPGGSANR